MTVPSKLLRLAIIFISLVASAFAQANKGELQLSVSDATGRVLNTSVRVASRSNQFARTFVTGPDGELDIHPLAFGIYRVDLRKQGFADFSKMVEIRSSSPVRLEIVMKVAAPNESVTVHSSDTLLALDQAGEINTVGDKAIRDRLGSIPGRSLQDLVNSLPGWLYEGNAVLHPRGSEYQTQFVVDGVPLTDNRSPSFGPAIEADAVQSLTIYTAGIPAEYGRKMGGVIEVDTLQNTQDGLHGQLVLSGGSFASAATSGQVQYSQKKNSIGADASGSRTDRYLNPVVPQNDSNTATLGDFAANYERVQSPGNKFTLDFRREFSRFDIPNELVQQAAGQRQTAANRETMAIASYLHAFSDRGTVDAYAMVRENANHFNSSADSTPIEVFQHNRFREEYFKIVGTISHGVQEWKGGVESDNTFLRENFSYLITDRTQFDPATPSSFAYSGSRPELDQSAFLQDQINLHRWTIAAGLRWDHYQLLLNDQSIQPRLAVSRYFPSASLKLHFSYDRVFQTPSFENLLLSSSKEIEALNSQNFLRLPVKPSTGDYYEAGASKELRKQLRLDANYFRRILSDYADDDQIENTTISFPIAFRKAIIYGIEGKLDLPDWHGLSGFASYSYEVGNVWFPVTGGLFLGADATDAAAQISGHLPDSQDQRNTFRGRLRYQVVPRLWIAGGAHYDSGLPFDFDGNPATVLAEYGQQVLNRLNFSRGRIDPAFQVDASAGITLRRSDRLGIAFQADGENLNNILDVLDFGGLFSGNALGPPRSFSLRLSTTF
ncbi:MAG: TonB-dependent receptor [Terracidiphilus sp.]